jgi:hypothetical protein
VPAIINTVMSCQAVTTTAKEDTVELRLTIVGIPGADTSLFNDKGTFSMTLTEPSMRGLFKAGNTYQVVVAAPDAQEQVPPTPDAPLVVEKPSPVGLKVSVAVNVRGEDIRIIVDSSWTIGYLKHRALEASKHHRTEYGIDWRVFDAAGLVRRDNENIQDVLGNLSTGEWCLTLRRPGDIGY